MPTAPLEIEGSPRKLARSSSSSIVIPLRNRIGSGVALATIGGSGKWKDNQRHWQTLIFLLPLYYNPAVNGYRKPIPAFLVKRTVAEIQKMFSGYTLSRAAGWYLDGNTGVSDDLMRFEIDGVFTGSDLYLLHHWRKKLRRRFRQNYIYMRLIQSGIAV